MRHIILVAFFFVSFISCRNNDDKKSKSTDSDSALFKQVYAELENARKDLKIAVSVRDTSIIRDKKRLINLIDTLQCKLKLAHLDQLKLIETENTVKILQVSIKHLTSKINLLNKKIEDLNESNIDISDRLKNTTINLYRSTQENKDLKKYIKFAIANVQIKAYRYTRTLIKKPKAIETDIAKEVKYIEVTFVVVANDKVNKTTYELNVNVSTFGNKGIDKKYPIYFNGEEINNSSIQFDDPNEFQVGYHHVDITLNDESIGSGKILLK